MSKKNEIANFELLAVEYKQLRQEEFSDELDENNSDWINPLDLPVKPVVGLWDNEDDSDTDNDDYIVPIIIGGQDR